MNSCSSIQLKDQRSTLIFSENSWIENNSILTIHFIIIYHQDVNSYSIYNLITFVLDILEAEG